MKLKYIGAVALTAFLYDPLLILYKELYYTLPNFSQYGIDSYAVVTGATDGIGLGFCEALASHGVNIILVSRNQNKLDKVAQALSGQYGIKTLTHAIDFSSATEYDYQKLKEKTDKVDVSILINNAGSVSTKRTAELTYNEINSLVTLNSSSVAHMLSIYLPTLQHRPARSAVVNLSSFVAVAPTPIASIQSATKAFTHYMSVGIAEEYKDSIDVLSFQPATVITKAAGNEKLSWRSCTVEQAVRGALVDLGRNRVSYGHWNHSLMAWAAKWMPEVLRVNLSKKYYPYYEFLLNFLEIHEYFLKFLMIELC